MQVTHSNKKICNVRPLGYTPKSHRECLRSLKYSYFNVSRPHSNKNPDLIRHDINLIFYPNFILNYQYSDQISEKANRWNLVFSKTSAIHFGCGGRTRTYDLRVMSPASYQLLHPAILSLVPKTGLEPVRGFPHRILSPARLPIPPRRRVIISFRIASFSDEAALLRKMAPRVGLEPTTYRLTADCSTIELSRRILMLPLSATE